MYKNEAYRDKNQGVSIPKTEGSAFRKMTIEKKEANLFFNLISELYENSSIIITSNKSFDCWAEMMGDEVMTVALLDRLLHHAKIYNMDGDSYRIKENNNEE